MVVSEVIRRLTEILYEQGDLPVLTEMNYWKFIVEKVEVSEEDVMFFRDSKKKQGKVLCVMIT